MGDSYKEIMVKRETPAGKKLLKGVMITFTALCVVAGLIFWPLLLVGAAMAAACFFFVPKLEVEFEYLYVNGELDVDAIYSKQRRKRQGSYDMSELEILAPSNSHALDAFRNKQGLKMKDYTSLDEKVKSYIMIFNKEKGQEMIKVELDDSIVQDIRRIAPRKVNLY